MSSKYLLALLLSAIFIYSPIYGTAPAFLVCPDPVNLQVSDLTDSTATLQWDAVAGAASYDLEVQDEQNFPSTFHLETNSNTNTYALTGLTPGVMYKFKVRTQCTGGDKSDWSDWVFFTAPNGGGGNGPCDMPSGLSVTFSNDTITLNWSAVNGAVSYTIEVEDEQNNPSNFHLEVNSNTNSYVLTGLTAGVQYKFKVKSNCGNSSSDYSPWFFFTAGGGNGGGGNGPCDMPSGLSVTVSNDTITLNWSAVNGAVSYTIEVEDEQNNPSNFHLEVNSNTNSYVLTGLTAGVQYKFKVKSNCGNSSSDYSPWFFFTASGGNGGGGNGPCDKPSGLSVSVSNDTITLNWTAVNGAVSYTIEVEDEQNNPSNFHLEVNSNTNSYVLTGLSPNVLYKFKVKTTCSNGNSGWSNWHFFTSNGNIGSGGNGNSCGIPTGLGVQNLGPNSATLTWTAVAGAISYTVEIEREKKNAAPWQMTLTATTNSLDITGLDANTRYKFKVRTNCGPNQHSGWSKRFQFKTPMSLQGDSSEDREEASSTSANHLTDMSVKVWPNPAREEALVSVDLESEGDIELRMYDLSGRNVYSQSLSASVGTQTLSIPVHTLPAGLYLLQARHAGEIVTVKVVVQQ